MSRLRVKYSIFILCIHSIKFIISIIENISHTLIEQEDFIGDTVLATFYADDSSEDPQTEALAYINIVDDNINEASQVFILKLDYEDNQFISDIFLNKRHLSLAKIQDNDRKCI